MRSVLAGLRTLFIPWGRRHAPRTVIGADPIAESVDQFSALAFYPFDDRAYLLGVEQFPGFGILSLLLAGENTFVSTILRVVYDQALDRVTRVEVASQDVDQLFLGAGAGDVIIGHDTTTVNMSLETSRLDIYGPGGDQPLMLVGFREVGFNVANIHMLTPPAPAGLTSAAPITITGASTTSFVKVSNSTQVEVFMSGGGFIGAGAGASVTFGILVSGGVGDFSIVKGSFSVLSNRIQFSATRLLAAFPAGTYTITPRWFRSAGASTVIMDATDASLSVQIKEVIEA